jgi:response regulator RpfG family c-di-GMP phosphodiesterase
VAANSSEYHTDYWLRKCGEHEVRRPILLVVDDHELVVRAVSRALRGQFEIVKAYNGCEAFRLIAEVTIDVAIVDHDLPDVKGTEILQRLHKNVPSAIRVLMSGRDIPGIDTLRSTGLVQYFLPKPLDLGEIRNCLQL